ncbi:Extracellular solute-binding protein, family 5 [Candidatus Sulfopaludibacter sp. SbA6]|nr:Extracellular solute-binding protein, family 5 [Candidatus Sulfopaludibacter sp. SbA6]
MRLTPSPFRVRKWHRQSRALSTANRALGCLLVLLALGASAATRPHYGGTLRVEIRESIESPDPPQTGPTLAQLPPGFAPAQWDAPSHAIYSADDKGPGGRPFLDAIEIQMARPLAGQSIDLDLGKADLVEMDANEPRRNAPARSRVWSSSPVRLLALVFGARIEDPRVREALALAVDRTAIHNVLLQRQGEISGALLPQWLSGYAFLFPAVQDAGRARSLLAGVPPAARTLSLAVPDPAYRRIADRIALNARDAGLLLSAAPLSSIADLRLIEVRIESSDPARALAALAAALALPEPPKAESPEALYAAERALLEGFRVVPLFHLPDVYGVNPRVKGAPGITPLGEWRFENLWLEPPRP